MIADRSTPVTCSPRVQVLCGFKTLPSEHVKIQRHVMYLLQHSDHPWMNFFLEPDSLISAIPGLKINVEFDVKEPTIATRK